MKYVEIPAAVQVKHRSGEPVRGEPVMDLEAKQFKVGPVMEPMTLFSYAECWWNAERMNAGGIKKRKIVEKIIAAFDKAQADNAAYIAIEDSWYDHLLPTVEDACYFKTAPLELQCSCFIEAITGAKTELPAHLAPPKTDAGNGTAKVVPTEV